MHRVVLSFLLAFVAPGTIWAQKACNISPSEVQQVIRTRDEISPVPGNPCKFSFFSPSRASQGAYTLEIRPQIARGVSNQQFADKIEALKSSNNICRMELNLGARAAFCYGGDDSELLILHGSVLSAIYLHNWAYGPNGGEHHSIQLAKVVFNVDPESAPLERPDETVSVLPSQQPKGTKAVQGVQLTKYLTYKSALKGRAETGDPDAEYDLGLLYEFPQDGTLPDRSGASYWYKQAAERGHVRAMYRLGLYYYDQDSDTEAYRYFEKAANIGFPPAMTKLGEMIVRENLKGNGRYYGLPWLEKAAKAGDPDAQNDLGTRAWELYLHPSSPERSQRTPVEWFTMASAGGSCEAAANLGGVYFNGLGVAQNAVLADQAFRKAESCPGAPAWVVEKARHFRELIAAHQLPDPSRSLPQQDTPSIRVDSHDGRTAIIVAAVILAIAAGSNSSGSTSSSDTETGYTFGPPNKICIIHYQATVPNPVGSTASYTYEDRTRTGYGFECP